MSTFEPPDFNLVHGSFEVVDIYTTAPFNTASDNRVATIFYNSNGGKAHRFASAKEKVKR